MKNLKHRTAKKTIRKALDNHVPKTKSTVRQVGIIADRNIEVRVGGLQEIFGTKDLNLSLLIWNPEKKKGEGAKNQFSPKDLSYFGKFKKESYARKFTEKQFDVLINFWRKPKLELLLASSITEAKLKTGQVNPEKKLNDLEIDVEGDTFPTFCNELKKYFKALYHE